MDLVGSRHFGRGGEAAVRVASPTLVDGTCRRGDVLVCGKDGRFVGLARARGDPKSGPHGEPKRQLTAFFTSALILASSVAVNCLSAKDVGHMAPSSSFAVSLKPSVAYFVLNFFALCRKQTTFPPLA
jgi:hypothetical protein